MAGSGTKSLRWRDGGALRVALAIGLAPSLLSPTASASSVAAAEAGSSEVHPERWPQLQPPLPRDAALEARIVKLLASMTLEEKVGQIVQGDLGSVTPEDVRKYRLGSVLAGGNSDPSGRYDAPAAAWLALADEFHRASTDTSGGGKAIPVLLGIDAVHGHNNVLGATLFPHNIALGAADDVTLVRQIAAATAVELRTTGFEWTFAPTVTVPRDDRWGRTYEGYSEDPALVARYATAVVEGLQGRVSGDDFLGARHVVASSKHFIGDGGTHLGKDKGDTRVSEATLRDVHGAGHLAAVQAGTQTVMASFSSWNGRKMHGHHGLLTGILKQRLGFDGFVVGDWNGHGEVPGCSNERCAAALLAGIDMFMAPDSWRAVYDNTLAQVRAGEIPLTRLDDAVSRILRVKLRLGLFEAGLPSKRLLGGHFEELGSAAHRQLAREAVRRSLVLLKNHGGVLPLAPKSHVLVAGDGADDIGKQSGGWTLSWQGTGHTAADFPGAQSIWAGIEATVESAGGTATLSKRGEYEQRPDVAIVVFGEHPYAEFLGDVPHLAYQPDGGRDLALLRRLKGEGIPVVAVFLSGRPLWVNREINASDAFVAAWLPGSEGGGVADVLFASASEQAQFDFVGRLPFSWPKTAVQGALNAGEDDYDPQFPLGYGLSYQRSAPSTPLPELSGLDESRAEVHIYFAQGKAARGWAWMVSEREEAGAPLDGVVGSTPSGNLRMTAIDHEAQEDARRLQWNGQGPARAWLRSEPAIDLSGEAEQGAALVATVRLEAVPTAAVQLGIGCGPGCRHSLALEGTLRALPAQRWTRLAIPLRCFATLGTDLARVSDLFELRTAGTLELSVARVALGTEHDRLLDCPKS